MKQVLLSIASANHHAMRPVTLWMSDDTKVGDIFLWGKRVCTVGAIYGTTLSHVGTECRRTERPHINKQAGIALDHHAN